MKRQLLVARMQGASRVPSECPKRELYNEEEVTATERTPADFAVYLLPGRRFNPRAYLAMISRN
jgi:hypothetical protein